MRIKIQQNNNGTWRVVPLSGRFEGKCIALADGLSLERVTFEGADICGDVCAVWGLEVTDDLIYFDKGLIGGLRINQPFNMREQHGVEWDRRGYTLVETGQRITGARFLWVLGDEMQAFGETLASNKPRQMAGGVAIQP